MQDIEKLRAELDQIHTELVSLLRKRFVVATKIWEIKKATALPFTDLKREQAVVHQFDDMISETSEQTAVQNILKSIVIETKKYLEEKLK